MKAKKLISGAVMCLASVSAMAGGLFTNTNQNPIFFRQPAQNAVIGVQGAYYNPAGLVFMNEGWHLGIGDQMAIQTRTIKSTYAPFVYNINNQGQSTKEFKGNTFAPLIPSIDLSYNQDKWAASFHFGVVSGGGSCDFDEGLGSFEAAMAIVPAIMSQAFNGYSADINFTGKSFGFGGQLNYAYKIIDNDNFKLSVAAGLRYNYVSSIVEGGIHNYQLRSAQSGTMVAATTALVPALTTALTPVVKESIKQEAMTGGMQEGAAETYAAGMAPGQAAALAQQYATKIGADKDVDCTQTGWALNPILNAHMQWGIVDFAVKYEFLTSVTLENSTYVNTTGIAAYEDGVKSEADVPALFAAGLNVCITPTLRAGAAMNVFFDKSADYNGREEKMGGNTLEWTAGIEYDINEKFTVSLGTQYTKFDFGENNDYLTDSSFSLPSVCLCGGLRYKLSDRLAFDLSAFNTFYQDADKKYTDYGGASAQFAALGAPSIGGNDNYMRTSLSFGLGVVYDF